MLPLILKTIKAYSKKKPLCFTELYCSHCVGKSGLKNHHVKGSKSSMLLFPSPLALGEKSVSMLHFPDVLSN